jgi:hypothetical protein
VKRLARWLMAAIDRLHVFQVEGARRDELAERRRQRALRLNNYQYAIRLTWRLKNLGRARKKAAQERDTP